MSGKKFLLAATAVLMAALAWPQEYHVALKELPTTPYYLDLLNAIAGEMGMRLDIQIVPSARADYLIATSRVDMDIPVLDVDEYERPARQYDSGSVVLYRSAFVLFSSKGQTIDIANLKAGNSKRYEIESDISVANRLGFSASPSTNVEGSLKKVNDGKIDGYIFSQTSTDPVAGKLSLPKVKRQLYRYFSLYYALKKGERGGVLDGLVAEGIDRLKREGRYEAIIGKLIAEAQYDNWQP
jgi:polar amino acid transport system substrate-binding protein